MATQTQTTPKSGLYKNPQESLVNTGRGDAFAQDISAYQNKFEQQLAQQQKLEHGTAKSANPEFTIAFNKTSFHESHTKQSEIKQLQETISDIQREVKQIRAYSSGLSDEVMKIEQAALQAIPEKVGIYHVRYYEMILQYLRGLKAKVGEAKTWLMAMQSKKASRGSAFGANTKKKGTQYSLSQEQQVARSVG
ncbi:hypothetical protein KBC70_00415 [Candidatus Woesebacteria bacterium]|jgi:hypothetical protein|nr:hypothetical protein [Candidatus Woesebacteria bacterium]